MPTVSGETVAYRGVRPTGVTVTLRLFFYEANDGQHVVGSAVDTVLFDHLRELVLRCGGEVPPALPLVGEGAVAGAGASTTFDALLAQLKQSQPKSDKTAQWKEWAGAACRQLYNQLKEVDLEGLDSDPARLSVFKELVRTAFLEAGFGSEVVRVIGFVTNLPQVQTKYFLAEECMGLYPKRHVKLCANVNGSNVDILYTTWNDYDNVR